MNATKLQQIIDELSLGRAVRYERGAGGLEGVATPPRIAPWQGGGWHGFLDRDVAALVTDAPRVNGHNGYHASGGWAVAPPWQASAAVGSGPVAGLGVAAAAASLTAGLDDSEEMGWWSLGVAAFLGSMWAFAKANKLKVAVSAVLWSLLVLAWML